MSSASRMTRDEIGRRYPDLYVVIEEPEWAGPGAEQLASGCVVAVGRDWDEAVERARVGMPAGSELVFQPLDALTIVCVSRYPAGEGGARLTWGQICERYPDRWVVLADHDHDAHELTAWTTARVLADGTSREEAMGQAREGLRAYSFYGCHYAGEHRGLRARLGERGIPI